jgi:hypothetical protein
MGGGGRKTTPLATASFFRSGYRQWRSLEESLGRAKGKHKMLKDLSSALHMSISFPFQEKI